MVFFKFASKYPLKKRYENSTSCRLKSFWKYKSSRFEQGVIQWTFRNTCLCVAQNDQIGFVLTNVNIENFLSIHV